MPSGVYKRTEKHKKYWFKKGHISQHKGKHLPKLSKETRKKISEALKGKKKFPFSKEHKRKLSKAKLGKPRAGNPDNWKHTEKTKRKISLAKTGKRETKEWKEKIGKSHNIDFYKKISLLGIQKQQNSKEPTSIEVKVYNELRSRGLLFETQKLINGRFLVDAYIPSLNLIIEADGDYWHSLDRVMKKDKAENAYLTKCGFNLLRLSETEINSGRFIERLG